MRIVWSREATAGLAEIRRYIASDNPKAARRVADRIRNAVRRLGAYPRLGRPGREPGTRELVIPGTPYLISYTATSDRIVILTVLHGAQERRPNPQSAVF